MAFLHDGYAKKWHYDETTSHNGETTSCNNEWPHKKFMAFHRAVLVYSINQIITNL